MELHNLTWYEGNLVTELWWEKQSPAEREEYQAYWNMNEEYEQEEKSTSSLTIEP